MIYNKIIIIGAGHNGLVCANYLTKSGFKVTLLEKNKQIGGAVVTEELFPGSLFSTYAFFCYLFSSKIIKELELKKYGFDIIHVDPYRFHPFLDNNYLVLWGDVEKTQQEFSRFSQEDAENYPLWIDFWYKCAKLFHPYLFKPGTSLSDIRNNLDNEEDFDLFDFITNSTMNDLINKFFKNEKIKTTFVHCQDVGDPDLPGSLLANIYYRLGMLNNSDDIGLIRGGAGNLTQSLFKSAENLGVEVRLNSEVKEIVVHHNKVIGILLTDGTFIEADVVISNLDPKSTFLKLMKKVEISKSFFVNVEQLATNVAYGKFHAVLKGLPDAKKYLGEDYDVSQLGMIKLCPDFLTYKNSWAEAQQGKFPRIPIMDICIPSIYDTSLTHKGKHTISIWISFFPAGGQLSNSERNSYVHFSIIFQLEKYFPGFSALVESWTLITPKDLEDTLGLTDGNIRHLNMQPSQMFNLRPCQELTDYSTPIHGLYLCGAGTYPGGEITGIPGYNCAKKVINDASEGESNVRN